MDLDALTKLITSDPGRAGDFLAHVYAQGVFLDDEWFSVGDFTCKKGKDDSGGGSVLIKIPECPGRDKAATGDSVAAVNGPISILRAIRNCSATEAADELKSWLVSRGGTLDNIDGDESNAPDTAYPWSQLVTGSPDHSWR